MPFDYLAVADELLSGRIQVAGEPFSAEYRETAMEPEAEFEPLFDPRPAAQDDRPQEPLPPVDPESVAAELELGRCDGLADFDRLRRSFALSNHPDRVAPHLRNRALARMQIANMLIDEAKRKALSGLR